MNYKGVIIAESLQDIDVLKSLKILDTEVETVTGDHKTPWIDQWTLHNVEVREDQADEVATKLSDALDIEHNWYADYKNNNYHFIIYRNKVFKVDLRNPVIYKEAKAYGVSLGIPEYQVDFVLDDKVWER